MRNVRYTCEDCGQSVHAARRLHHEGKHRRAAMREFGPVSKGERMWHKELALRVVVVTFSRAEADTSALERENAALKRTVEDLAHALRKANAAAESIRALGMDERPRPLAITLTADQSAASIRRTLDRHGLLRDVDRPEMVAEVFGDNGATHGRCVECGAGPGEACTPNCEDRR